jgi:hypothetical protein
VIRFLRRIFGRHGPSIYDNQHCDDGDYDTETYDMILSSIDLLEHLRNAGENVELERAVSHFFVGESCDIKRAGRMFRGLGFLIGVEEDNRLQIVERAILSDAWVARTIPFMHRTGGEFELDYNGWDCGRALDPTEELVII